MARGFRRRAASRRGTERGSHGVSPFPCLSFDATSATSLDHLFENELKDSYDAEQRIEESLDELAEAVENDDVARAS